MLRSKGIQYCDESDDDSDDQHNAARKTSTPVSRSRDQVTEIRQPCIKVTRSGKWNTSTHVSRSLDQVSFYAHFVSRQLLYFLDKQFDK